MEIVEQLRRWTIEKALPLWSTQGLDRERGGFQERLNPDGTPDLSAPRRLRVQARQIYVYAHAAELGWFASGRKLAVEGVAFILEKYRAPDGKPGYISALAPDNAIADNRRDTYDHMFVLLALAWAAKTSGDAQILAALEQVLAFVDAHLAAGDGSLIEGIPASLPRRQNPHMHAFEAMLAMHETVAHPQALARAQIFLAMMRERFLDPATNTIGEYFTDEWKPSPGLEGRRVEPGHMAEWAWLIRKYERIAAQPRGPLPSQLLQAALRWSEPQTGFLLDEADRTGPPLQSSRRTWPQTELAKAWIAEAEIGKAGAADKAGAALAALAEHYLDKPFVGGWTDQFDRSGRALTVHMPASTFYHVFCAIAEADRVLTRR